MKKIKAKYIIYIILGLILSYGSVQAMGYIEESKNNLYYYSFIDDTYDMTLDDIKDKEGNIITQGKIYKLIGFDESLNPVKLTFVFKAEKPSQLLERGTYVKIKVSQNEVKTVEKVEKDQVPEKVLKKIASQI